MTVNSLPTLLLAFCFGNLRHRLAYLPTSLAASSPMRELVKRQGANKGITRYRSPRKLRNSKILSPQWLQIGCLAQMRVKALPVTGKVRKREARSSGGLTSARRTASSRAPVLSPF